MLREVGKKLNARSYAAFSRAMTPYTRKTLPIGLAVTKVGPSAVQRARTTVNRSRATAKTPRISSGDTVDSTNPAAYKNNNWQYYLIMDARTLIFTNSRNGQPFMIDSHGRRKPVPARFNLSGDPPYKNTLIARKPRFHTWEAYQKRLLRQPRLNRGGVARHRKYQYIDQRVANMLERRGTLNNVSLPNLIWWSGISRQMSIAYGLKPYVKHGGRWYRRNRNPTVPLTKNNVIRNIHHMHNW
jgi:hypothetical protein